MSLTAVVLGNMSNKGEPIVQIRVVSGRHAGAKQLLSAGALTIGSSMDADVVLTDPSVEAIHAQITLSALKIRVQAAGNPISLGTQHLTTSGKAESRYPARLVLGDIELELTGLQETQSLDWFSSLLSRFSKSQLWGGAFAASFAVALFVTFIRAKDDTIAALPVVNAEAFEQAKKAERSAAQNVSTRLAHSAAEALRERLLALTLDSVVVTVESGMVIAKGTIISSSREDWNATQVWFDQSFGQKTVLQSQVAETEVNAAKSPISIQSIWAGKIPYLIDGSGEKLFEGAILKDGWVIEKIEEGKVRLRRNQELLSLKV